MRTETITYKIYKFNELSSEAKQKAIESYSDINVDHEWWSFIYDDIETIEGKCESFDMDRADYCNIKIDCYESTAQLIVLNHGVDCQTRKIADKFTNDKAELVKKFSDGIKIDVVTETNESEFDAFMEDIDAEFHSSLSREYLNILRNEYEWGLEEEQVIGTIISNEYEFTQDGTQY